MANYYDGLLKLCGFEDDEIEKERPRVERVLQKIGLSPEDMKRAEKRVTEQHDVTLLGARKLLRAWLMELFDLILAREEGKKVVYYGYPSIQGPGMAIKAASKGDLYIGCPDVILCHTIGQIFNKLAPVLEAAERRGLPPGHGLCSLQQVRNGGLALGIIPVPDLVTGSSYYCDMGSKADELLQEIYGHRAIYIDGSMDSRWGEYPNCLPERIKFLGAQINKLFDTIREVLGVAITQEAWDKALFTSRQLFSVIGQLTQLMKADPMPISGVELSLALQLIAASTGRSMTEGPEAISILCQEIRDRVEKGIGVVEKGTPRVMVFIHHFSDPSVTHMMEEAGLAPSMTMFAVPPVKRDPSLTFETLGEERAEAAMRDGAYHSSFGIAKRFEDAAKSMDVDGVIWNYLYNCRPTALGSHLIKKWIEERTDIPTLSLEMDIYDSRSYGAAALKTRVEAFAELLRARKAVAKKAL